MRPVLTLLTDFGTADGYVAEMKGVLLSALPDATIVDVAHDVGPQDTEGARLAFARYWRRYPPGTAHIVIVDPGVGTRRAALCVQSDGRYAIGPDTGVLSPAMLFAGARVVRLPIPRSASATFHGRDVFAPAAAALAGGTPLEAVGSPFDDPIVRRTPEPRRSGDGLVVGEVIHIDRFGNAITNLLAPHGGSVEVGGRTLPIRVAYGDAEPGGLLAVTGSSGLLEIARRDGDAARTLGLARGTPVALRSGGR